MEIGYVVPENPQKSVEANKTYSQMANDELSDKIGKL